MEITVSINCEVDNEQFVKFYDCFDGIVNISGFDRYHKRASSNLVIVSGSKRYMEIATLCLKRLYLDWEEEKTK